MNVYYKVTPIDQIRFHTNVLHGSIQYMRQKRSYCCCRAVWLLLWVYGALVTLVFMHSAGAALGLLVAVALQLRHLVPFETYVQRCFLEQYGTDAVREMMLVMDDHGVTEREAEVAFYAPWTKIREAWIYRDLLILQIESARHIVIPRHSLDPGGVTLESILEEVLSRIGSTPTKNG